jgi:hypothetical protein
LKHWPQMFGAATAKVVSSFSLFLLIAIVHGDSFRELSSELNGAKSVSEAKQVLKHHADMVAKDEDVADAAEYLGDDYSLEDVQRMVSLRALSEQGATGASQQAKSIKSNPLYRDPGIQEQSNWLDGALKRLRDLLPKNQRAPNIDMPNVGVPTWIIPAVWGILGLLILGLLFFVLKHISWKRTLRRRAKTVLEDDEPERTLDEWLAMADDYASQGKYREAVRAMYLSCLLKFDEAGIARFIRGETNWEHLSRIRSSTKLPDTIDFVPPTQAFDRIWYGFHVNGIADFDQFRAWYQGISENLRSVKK